MSGGSVDAVVSQGRQIGSLRRCLPFLLALPLLVPLPCLPPRPSNHSAYGVKCACPLLDCWDPAWQPVCRPFPLAFQLNSPPPSPPACICPSEWAWLRPRQGSASALEWPQLMGVPMATLRCVVSSADSRPSGTSACSAAPHTAASHCPCACGEGRGRGRGYCCASRGTVGRGGSGPAVGRGDDGAQGDTGHPLVVGATL